MLHLVRNELAHFSLNPALLSLLALFLVLSRPEAHAARRGGYPEPGRRHGRVRGEGRARGACGRDQAGCSRDGYGDILRADVDQPKLVIGIFMSPFNVHYNRAPLDGTVGFVHRHPAYGKNLNMGPMHWRILFGRKPLYENSVHIVQNERTVTLFSAEYRCAPLPLYAVQIGARTVNGIDSCYKEGDFVDRGATFGMIRIGSQVDLVVPWRADLGARVHPGAKVRARETILIQ